MTDASPSPWFVYLVACGDGSLYGGVTTDPARRFQQHARGTGARYTRSRGALAMVWAMEVEDRSEALKLEARLKRQPVALKRLLAGQVQGAFGRRLRGPRRRASPASS